jgi:hypothetical protein
VTNEGNVVPWLLAAKALVHNGCTTGIEAYALDVPALAYRASTHEQYDRDFHRLPNHLSHQCFDLASLVDTLKRILDGDLGVPSDEASLKLIARHLAARQGPLASERIVAVLDKMVAEWNPKARAGIRDRAAAWVWANRRKLKKRIRGYRSNMSHNRSEFLKYRYPDISEESIRERIDRYRELLGYRQPITVNPFGDVFFRISR